MYRQKWSCLARRWLIIPLMMGLLGCTVKPVNPRTQEQTEQEREQKIRDEAAKLTEHSKPEVEWTARKLGQAAERLAQYGFAAIEGVLQGWSQGGHQALDINSASEDQLMALPGITQREARKIIQERPYRSTEELVQKRILSDAACARIRDQITVKYRQ